jgi:hypothetical protein
VGTGSSLVGDAATGDGSSVISSLVGSITSSVASSVSAGTGVKLGMGIGVLLATCVTLTLLGVGSRLPPAER